MHVFVKGPFLSLEISCQGGEVIIGYMPMIVLCQAIYPEACYDRPDAAVMIGIRLFLELIDYSAMITT